MDRLVGGASHALAALARLQYTGAVPNGTEPAVDPKKTGCFGYTNPFGCLTLIAVGVMILGIGAALLIFTPGGGTHHKAKHSSSTSTSSVTSTTVTTPSGTLVHLVE